MKSLLLILALAPRLCLAYDTEILSDPVGARIIVNNEYVGVTPVKVDLWHLSWSDQYAHNCALHQDSLGASLCAEKVAQSELTIKALPKAAGCVQTTQIRYHDKVPSKMFFDTGLCPSNPSVDVNVQ
jgi:hypothetical protein